MCVCVCVCVCVLVCVLYVCVRACVRVCVRVRVFKDLFYLTDNIYIDFAKYSFLVFTVSKVVSVVENKILRIKDAVKLGIQLVSQFCCDASYTKKCQV